MAHLGRGERRRANVAKLAAAQREQLDLLAKLNQQHMDQRPGGSELASRVRSYELAYRMQSAAPEAVDLSPESEQTLTCMAWANNQPTNTVEIA